MCEKFGFTDSPLVVVCGHYGTGKTNFSMNLALDAVRQGKKVTLIDLDVVNPYFRSSDYARVLGSAGVHVIAPVFARSNLDSPSLTGEIIPAIKQAYKSCDESQLLVIDAGGDDVGATALGRFSAFIKEGRHEVLYVVNRSRNLTQDAHAACGVLREIESRSQLRATALVNNTHLKQDTEVETIEQGLIFALEVSRCSDLPLACTTVPVAFIDTETLGISLKDCLQNVYPVQVYVCTPWE